MVLPSNARPGDRVKVYSTGWPAGAQVQAVLCGDDAIRGSSACHLPGAATGRADRTGVIVLDLVVGRPPRPCPCVVRVSSFSTDAPAQNLPINVIGHPTGTPPLPSSPVADLRLDNVAIRLSGSTLGGLLGLGGPAQVVVTVKNAGNADARVPELPLRLRVRRARVDRDHPSRRTRPRPQSRDVVIDVDVPAGNRRRPPGPGRLGGRRGGIGRRHRGHVPVGTADLAGGGTRRGDRLGLVAGQGQGPVGRAAAPSRAGRRLPAPRCRVRRGPRWIPGQPRNPARPPDAERGGGSTVDRGPEPTGSRRRRDQHRRSGVDDRSRAPRSAAGHSRT